MKVLVLVVILSFVQVDSYCPIGVLDTCNYNTTENSICLSDFKKWQNILSAWHHVEMDSDNLASPSFVTWTNILILENDATSNRILAIGVELEAMSRTTLTGYFKS